MSFDIVTYCSENYRNSLAFSLPWWVHKSGCERIIIYTDGIWDLPDVPYIDKEPEVEVYTSALFPPSERWIDNVGRLPLSLYDYVKNECDDRKFFFIGTDCITIKNVSAWFRALRERNKIFGGIRVGPCGKFPTNHFFGINTKKMQEFVRLWGKLSESLCECGIMTTPGKQAYDQLSYMLMIGYNQQFKDDMLPLDYMQVLSECDDVDAWEQAIKERVEKNVPIYGLHFKGGRWKDENLVDRILTAAGVKENDFARAIQ